MRILMISVLYLLGFIPTLAHADIYGYIDAQGSAHFAVEKLDERYQLFARGDQAFDSSSLTSNAPVQSHTPLFRYLSQHPNLKKFDQILMQASREFSVDPALLKAVMAAESGFNPSAISPKGAIGLMQVMPATAERYGLMSDRRKTVRQKLADPQTNIRLGARYLRDLHQMFPDQPQLVLASYNAGEGAVQKYANQIPPYPETRNYVKLVTQFYKMYRSVTQNAANAFMPDASAHAIKRITMTIPARQNMPTAFTQN